MKKYKFENGGTNNQQNPYDDTEFYKYINSLNQANPGAIYDDNSMIEGDQPSADDSEWAQKLSEYDDEQNQTGPIDELTKKIQDLQNQVNAQTEQVGQDQQDEDLYNSNDWQDYVLAKYDVKNPSVPFTTDDKPVFSNPTPGKNNVGNIRGTDGAFKSYNTQDGGKQALINQLSLYQSGKTKTGLKPTSTLYDAMAKYAPYGDGNNNPKSYAEFIAKRLGVSPTIPINKLNTTAWANAIAIMEGNTKS